MFNYNHVGKILTDRFEMVWLFDIGKGQDLSYFMEEEREMERSMGTSARNMTSIKHAPIFLSLLN